MKILALSDIHNELGILGQIIKKTGKKGIDLIIICGDLTDYGPKDYARKILELLDFAPVLAVPGNLDLNEVKDFLEEEGISLHGKYACKGDFYFAGFGGALVGGPGRLLFSEEEIKKGLIRGLKNIKSKREKIIIVTHIPPKNTKIDYVGMHIGSNAVKEFILEKQPLLLLCGHAHAAYGKEFLGKTLCINVAAVKEGRAAVIKVGERKVEVEEIRL